MKTKVLLALAILCVSPASFAADIAQTINPLADATKIMGRCAVSAKKISSMPAPPGQLEARAAHHYNEMLIKEHAKVPLGSVASAKPKELNPALLKKIAPEHLAFMQSIQAERDELQKCGEEYIKINQPMKALVKKTSDSFADPKKVPNEDDKKVGAALMAYMKASENLATEIAALSKDPVHQRYVGRTIRKYFLGQNI